MKSELFKLSEQCVALRNEALAQKRNVASDYEAHEVQQAAIQLMVAAALLKDAADNNA